MKAIAAGHLCLDIIPAFREGVAQLEPGKLIEVGSATIAAGGGVANVGQALLKLGVDTTLIGKVGDDAFGSLLENALLPGAARSLIRAAGESTSYSVVLSMPGVDRIFLHHAGCNATFSADDVDLDVVANADLFYFGYPPLLRRTYLDGGRALASMLAKIRALGVATVLDLSLPDAASEAGRTDWRGFLERVLPHTDFLMPSAQEVCDMLDVEEPAEVASLAPIAETLLAMGAKAVVLKLGARGLYLRSRQLGSSEAPAPAVVRDAAAWSMRELWSPVFEADVKGTTGAGDATIAGFVAALLRGGSPEACVAFGAAVGGASVESLDAVAGIPSHDDLVARLERGWPRVAHEADPNSWRASLEQGVYRGRHDRSGG